MSFQEYLVAHGKSGGFGRFASAVPLDCRRGDRVVVRSRQVLELGTVLCPVTPRQQRVLNGTPVGELLRPATSDDESALYDRRDVARQLFDAARQMAKESELPIEVLDVELSLDAQSALLQFVAGGEPDLEEFAQRLSETHHIAVMLENLALPKQEEEEHEEEEHGGCGKPGCGHATGGGCSNCGSGGCSSCGSGGADLREYFAHLRGKMEESSKRTPLV